MSEELEGQMALFELDGDVCKYCGDHCTSSKECVELAGELDDPP